MWNNLHAPGASSEEAIQICGGKLELEEKAWLQTLNHVTLGAASIGLTRYPQK